MLNDPTTDSDLKSRIDTPDFAEALAADADGSFHASVTAYLDAWKARIKAYQDAGVSTGEFQDLSRLTASMDTAGRVLEFFVKLQTLKPAQDREMETTPT